MIKRIHKLLYVLQRAGGSSNVPRRRILFHAYIFPHFLYGIQLYLFCTVSLRAKLEALLRRCCRLVFRDTGIFPLHTAVSLYNSLDILPLRLMFQHSGAVLMHQILILNQIPRLRSLFHVTEHTAYNARRIPLNALVLSLPPVRTEKARHNFAYWGAKLWNSVPAYIQRCSSANEFSATYRAFLRTHISAALDTHYDLLNFL